MANVNANKNSRSIRLRPLGESNCIDSTTRNPFRQFVPPNALAIVYFTSALDGKSVDVQQRAVDLNGVGQPIALVNGRVEAGRVLASIMRQQSKIRSVYPAKGFAQAGTEVFGRRPAASFLLPSVVRSLRKSHRSGSTRPDRFAWSVRHRG